MHFAIVIGFLEMKMYLYIMLNAQMEVNLKRRQLFELNLIEKSTIYHLIAQY